MKYQKDKYTAIIAIVLFALAIMPGFETLYNILILKKTILMTGSMNTISLITVPLMIILSFIWLLKAYKEKRLILWTHILAGFLIIKTLIELIIISLAKSQMIEMAQSINKVEMTTNLFNSLILLLIIKLIPIIVLWITYVRHLKKKTIIEEQNAKKLLITQQIKK